jgi:hypothetical protein
MRYAALSMIGVAPRAVSSASVSDFGSVMPENGFLLLS